MDYKYRFVANSGFADRIGGLERSIRLGEWDATKKYWIQNGQNGGDINTIFKGDLFTLCRHETLPTEPHLLNRGDWWQCYLESPTKLQIANYLHFSDLITAQSLVQYDIGIHLRWYDRFQQTPEVGTFLKHQADRVIANSNGPIFMATDSRELNEYFSKNPKVHLNTAEYAKSQFVHRSSTTAFLRDMIDFYTLTRCKTLYTTFGHFSVLAARWNGNQIKSLTKGWDGSTATSGNLDALLQSELQQTGLP